ncbi:cutinase family protein [Candidatus Saccharibacteria bacterium]|nr:cutinase family protein [Candidatus Saccharibacteria bacterium]
MQTKIRIKKGRGQKRNIKIRYLILSFLLILSANHLSVRVSAKGCPDVKVIFARGSGGELNVDQNYLAFKDTLEKKLKTTDLDYEFVDLDYPAISMGIDNLGATLRAFFGAGEAYEFGDSVNDGVSKLKKLVNGSACPGTKYVLGGYSQGAMVVSKALKNLMADRIIFAATFGDPKIYLPEGEGKIPDACSGKNLSDYRMYVPDCHAYKGLLGAYIPYEPAALVDKLGTWCNKKDIFCSSHINLNDHVSYVSDDLYEDASRVIFDKITQTFGLENQISSPHDTAIVIDSTGSMASLIEKYKGEALRLAKETLESGGRVALYDYRDLDDPYTPVKRCDFTTCTLETFASGLEEIQANGGGDSLESMLSASFHVMKELSWQKGATKSLVVLTDDGFLSPDRDGITYAEVVKLSKTIDPVNFYVITSPDNAHIYQELAEDTGGMVVTETDNLSLLTDYILERYDSLPRVEEDDLLVDAPFIVIDEVVEKTAAEVEIAFSSDGEEVLVILNDQILGATKDRRITIGQLDRSLENHISLVPLSQTTRGEGTEIVLGTAADTTGIETGATMGTSMSTSTSAAGSKELIKAPNTGRL